MANIQKNAPVQRVVDLFSLQAGVDVSPTQSGNQIIPTVDVTTPTSTVIRTGLGTGTGSVTLLATPADKDFYLRTAQLSSQSNVTCDNTQVFLAVTINGVSVSVLIHRKLSLTVHSDSESTYFGEKGIRIDRGTNIIVGSTFGAGSCFYSGVITGYFE